MSLSNTFAIDSAGTQSVKLLNNKNLASVLDTKHDLTSTPVTKRAYNFHVSESWDHDSNQLVKVSVKVDGVWYDHASFTYNAGNGKYYPDNYITYDAIIDEIKVDWTFHQDGYNCDEHGNYKYTINKSITGFPTNSTEIHSDAATDYHFRTAIVWTWWTPAGGTLKWY